MDLLFSRYASPFLLLDNYILVGRFSELIDEFIESENEKRMWEFYLYKVHDMTFEEYKNSLIKKEVTEEQLETTISNSIDTLNDFIPDERG